MCTTVSIFNDRGDCQLSAELSNPKAAANFVESRIEEFLDYGAKYVMISDEEFGIEQTYSANGIADCIFAVMNWSPALVKG